MVNYDNVRYHELPPHTTGTLNESDSGFAQIIEP